MIVNNGKDKEGSGHGLILSNAKKILLEELIQKYFRTLSLSFLIGHTK
jgi:hypothetical protein